MTGGHHDIFISHAGEDKATVARPLAEALEKRGWAVWLDELELTIGDSLSNRIDRALANTRFGVVVLSPSFFGKAWPERELAGLAAREIDTGTKVILPVWHKVDHSAIARHSPVLADRLGALTSNGIDHVADELSRAVESPGADPPLSSDSTPPDPSIADSKAPSLIEIPTTPDARREVIEQRPIGWEYRLYAGVLMEGRIDLESKWLDHELKMTRGPRREPGPEGINAFLSNEMGWARRKIEGLQTVFDPEILERAFGKSGEAGDPVRIERVARGILHMYESMLDWAANLRNVAIPSEYETILELTARTVDGPVRQIRDFIQNVGDQVARVEVLIAEAKEDEPIEIYLTLTLELDEGLEEELVQAFEAIR